jgi:hypothetical protein
MKRKKGEPLLKNKTPVNSPLTHLIAIEVIIDLLMVFLLCVIDPNINSSMLSKKQGGYFF